MKPVSAHLTKGKRKGIKGVQKKKQEEGFRTGLHGLVVSSVAS